MANLKVHVGDSNEILPDQILPTMTYDSFRKGLLFLDPYGLHLDWRVVEAAGKTDCVDVLINFPVMDINRNALRRDVSAVDATQVERMNRFYGADESVWREVAYEEEKTLFDWSFIKKKPGNEPIVEAYRARLKEVAGFKYVSQPLAMINEQGAPIFYLIGASQAKPGLKVFNGVFQKWRKKGVRINGPAEHNRVD